MDRNELKKIMKHFENNIDEMNKKIAEHTFEGLYENKSQTA